MSPSAPACCNRWPPCTPRAAPLPGPDFTRRPATLLCSPAIPGSGSASGSMRPGPRRRGRRAVRIKTAAPFILCWANEPSWRATRERASGSPISTPIARSSCATIASTERSCSPPRRSPRWRSRPLHPPACRAPTRSSIWTCAAPWFSPWASVARSRSLSSPVHSKPVRGEPEAWTLHATATFVPERAGEAPEPGDLAAMRREIAEEVPRDEVYQALATQGLDYGPTLRGIERVWRRNGEALGCVSLTELLRHETDAYQIHPAVLDAALQVLAATTVTSAGQGSDDCYVPVGCRRVRLDRRPAGGETLWSHTVLEPGTAPGASELRASLRLFDDSGGSVAELTGLRLARVGVGRRVAAPALAERDTWLYRVRWQQAAWPAGDAAGDLPEAGSSRWLILADRDGLAAALQRQLEARGQLCVLLPLEDSEAAAAHAIRQRLEAERSPLRGVIHLWSTGTASLQTAQTLGCNAVLHLVQSLVMRGAALGSPQLWLVTRGTQPVLSTEPADIAQAPLWGLGRTIAFELPELKCTLVDLDPAVDATAAATLLARQLGVADAEDQVALRAGHRWVPRLVPLQSCADGPEPLRDDGTYLITGGLGGLGLAVVGWMIEQGARHLVLVGRSAPSQAALAAVERMRRMGAEVAVLSADVAAEAELASA